MEKVRIGNDLRVNFSVYRNGEPESFDGATNISTKIVNESYNKTIAHTYSIVGNVVQFEIDALELKQCGKCRVFISYTKVGDYTVDSPAFELVQYTEDTGGTEVIGIEIVKINISGDIGINRDGASSYEVWESYPGNEWKTIEQYFEWLRENPTKIDLDGLNSNIEKLHFKPDTLVQLANIGDVRYSSESKTLEVKVSDTVSIQLGQEMQTRVKNDEAIQINNGQMVYINSAVGANPLAKIASTSNADIAQRTFGMATENIPANRFGAITTEGLVRDINTSAFPEGAMLWLGANGNVTNIEPTAPTSKISVGMVLRSNANNGIVYVKIRAIARNQKLSDVYAPTLTGGDVLRWNNTTLRFEAFNITTALGSKVDTSRTITAGNGLTGGGDLTADRTININPADDSLVVTADNIKVNTNNTLTSTSTTQPLSANQGKVLNEKVVQVETDLNIKNAEQDASIKSIEQLLSQSNMNQTAQVSSSGRESISLPKTASNGGMDVKLDGLTAQNLVVNGDFRNGTTGWDQFNVSNFNVSNGAAILLTNGQSVAFVETSVGNVKANEKYYAYTILKSTSSQVALVTTDLTVGGIIKYHPGNGVYQRISGIYTQTIDKDIKLRIRDYRTTGIDNVYVKENGFINLTATFGAGNEPDLDTCDAMFSYFEGTKSFAPTGRVKTVGKNLLNKDKYKLSNCTIKIIDNGFILTATGPTGYAMFPVKLDNKKDYRMSCSSTRTGATGGGMHAVTSDNIVTSGSANELNMVNFNGISSIYSGHIAHIRCYANYNGNAGDSATFTFVQVEIGTKKTSYEPYKETELYITAPELKSNGLVKDEVRKGANGYELVKRVGVGTLGNELIANGNFESGLVGTASNGNGSESTWTLNTVNPISGTQDGKLISTVPPTLGAYPRISFNGIGGTGAAVISFDYKVLSGNFSLWGIISGIVTTGVSKPLKSSGTFNALFYKQYSEVSIVFTGGSLGEIQIDNVSIKMLTTNETPLYNFTSIYNCNNDVNYTISTPVITPIDHAGILNSAESGTVFHEPVVADAGVYGTNLTVFNTTYPISSLEEIIVHTNVDTYLDVSKAVIASDGLSFTHPDLRAGDLVLFTYFFNKEKVNGLITATYYDGRYVIADTANGKFYKWGVKATNGVATIQLTEV